MLAVLVSCGGGGAAVGSSEPANGDSGSERAEQPATTTEANAEKASAKAEAADKDGAKDGEKKSAGSDGGKRGSEGDREGDREGEDPPEGARKGEKAKLPEGFPEYRDFYEDSGSEPIQIKSAGSAGAIPAVKPFNFGRDPGGPEDKTLYLTVPRLGLEGVPVHNSTSEEDLRRSAVHVPATGFPWQEGANVFIAGHRIGYEGTGSYRIFYDIDQMKKGDEIILTDANGEEYRYRMTSLKIVGTENVEVMNPVEGKSVVSLQSCTLPDYKERVIVQGELVESEGA